MDIQRQILDPIDQALAENDRAICGRLDCIQADAWAMIYESFQEGYIETIEQAEAKFESWKEFAGCVGLIALRPKA